MTITRHHHDFGAIIALEYDALIHDSGKAVKQSDVREALAERIRPYVEESPRDIEGEVARIIATTLPPIRDGRTQVFRRELDYILDYLTNPDEGAVSVELILDYAFPLGTVDGQDKTLRFWTREDFMNASRTRFQQAAAATHAAAEFDRTIQRILNLMDGSGAAVLDGLFQARAAA